MNSHKNIQIYFAVFLTLSAAISVFAYLSSGDWVKQNIQVFYLIHFILGLALIPLVKEKMLFLFSPSFLAFSYSYFAYIVGAWAFNKELIIWKRDLTGFQEWEHANIMVSYTVICDSLVHFSYFLLTKKVEPQKTYEAINATKRNFLIFLAIICFFGFSLFSLDVTALGGLGDYSIIPKTLSALILISILALNRIKSRYFYYLIIIIVFASFSFNDKREAVLLLLCIFLLEAVIVNNLKLSLKKITLVFAAIFLVTYLILAMSILRGYGAFNTTSFQKAIILVPDYIAQEEFIPAFLQNIETVISFYHSHQAIEYIENDPSLMTHGATIVKFLFVPIPRSLIDKPVSIVEAYTSHFDLKAYQENVSWPIIFYSELYWNFAFWGCWFILPIFLFFNKFYLILINALRQKKVLSALVLLFMYQYFIFFMRGSGFDLYFFYLILSSFIFAVFFLIPYSLLIWSSRRIPYPDAT